MRIILDDDYSERLRGIARRKESGAAAVRRLIDDARRRAVVTVDLEAIEAARAEYRRRTGAWPEDT